MCMLLAFIVRHEAMKGNLKKTPTCENATQRGPCSTALFAQSLLHYSYCVPCPSLSLFSIFIKSDMDVMNRVTNALSEASCVKMTYLI